MFYKPEKFHAFSVADLLHFLDPIVYLCNNEIRQGKPRINDLYLFQSRLFIVLFDEGSSPTEAAWTLTELTTKLSET